MVMFTITELCLKTALLSDFNTHTDDTLIGSSLGSWTSLTPVISTFLLLVKFTLV